MDLRNEALAILDLLKNKKVELIVKNDKNAYLSNGATDNLQSVFSFDFGYGVYGDVVDGQIDSRNDSDTSILKAIESMLTYGPLVDKSELPDEPKLFYC